MTLDATAAETRHELKAKLKRLGVNQDQVAEAVDVSKAAISGWFSGDLCSPILDRAIPAFIRGLETETKRKKEVA